MLSESMKGKVSIMSNNKKNQKMFYFSSEYVKKFVETRIEDVANESQRSSSYIIENLLLDGLLPQNDEAKHIILQNLYPEKDNGGIKKTLDALFSTNAAGIDWKSKHNNFKPLVDYCILYCDPSSHYTKDSSLDYFICQLRDIVSRIENNVYACIEPYDKQMFASNLEFAKLILKKAETSPQEIVYKECFELINVCWDMLYDWSITFRFLACVVRMCDFNEENSHARNALYNIISELSQEW